ncbi:MAG: hypothetical protein KIS92_10285 [Planctomycetota bacterium]|nr:hypothetical protein [Planctomycetota bacterium]
MSARLPGGLLAVLLCAASWAAGEEPPPVPIVPAGPPAAAAGEAAYVWAPKTIYRFQFQKSVVVKRASGENEKNLPRLSEINGVLVFEVESVDDAGTATAVLRFDNPRINLSLLPLDGNAPAETAGVPRPQAVPDAMCETLRETRWKATLSKTGAIAILSRTPEKASDWIQKTSNAGLWRKKVVQDLYAFLESDLRLGTSGKDHDLLFCPAEKPAARIPEGLPALRPARAYEAPQARPEGRVAYATARSLAKGVDPEHPIQVPYMDPEEPPIFVLPGKVENTAGLAVFDTGLHMLDQATEKYVINMTLRIETKKRTLEMAQQVQVEYRLTRLAPPIRAAAPAESEGP